MSDAVGELSFKYNERLEFILVVDEASILKYTDNTAMALGLDESLRESGGKIDQEHIRDPLRKKL